MTMTRIEIGEDVAVRRGGEEIPLPKSRKTRALVAFLLFEDGPASRERLCELFWDRAADPRGGLRWALTRIRRALGPDEGWLKADRLTVRLEVPGEAVSVAAEGERLLALVAGREHDDFALWLADLRRRMAEGGGRLPGARGGETAPAPEVLPEKPQQVVRYTTARDGTRIAHATMGKGRPLVKAANWLGHLEVELEVPVWAGLYRELAGRYCLHRYDERGSGLSDWEVDQISFEAFVSDLECVADALGLERFPLLGISQGGAVSIEYAARHPERVSALVLVGAYPAGWRFADPELRARREAEMKLVELGWGDNSPAYRQIFSQTFLPDGSPELIDGFNRFQRQTTSPANAARFLDSFGDIDVRHRLEEVRAPALILHSRGDQRINYKVGGDLAAALPNARFETLPSNNHIPLAGEPAFGRMMEAIDEFLREIG